MHHLPDKVVASRALQQPLCMLPKSRNAQGFPSCRSTSSSSPT